MIPGEAIEKFQILLTFSDMKAIYDAEAFTATDFVALVAVKNACNMMGLPFRLGYSNFRRKNQVVCIPDKYRMEAPIFYALLSTTWFLHIRFHKFLKRFLVL